jgi:dsRNA-specific ribonuclease
MPTMNILANLATSFQLSKEDPLFKSAIHPKSCGGEDEFKFLALYGDAILNLLLLEHLSRNNLKDSGQITEALHSFHNEETLYRIAKDLQVHEAMEKQHKTTSMTRNDLKESIEALLGASYNVKGLESCKEIVASLLQLAIKKKYLNPNPKGILQILFQKNSLKLPKYISKRVGGPDHQQLFQTTVTGTYEGDSYKIQSGIFTSKREAEKDAAKIFLDELGASNLLENSFFSV